ncbi:integrase [Hymenobacter luteus]|uniref:Integrase n=2 Tax=Hymenobacter TaxID=89966 RepID=A0A7W9SZP0_9BACT|nr:MULTISPECIES: tyrosine-type recombinase/integrase [Hymenobacter]MBB4601385.1 integrase [Hymenobacter latericoloratus]MBB6058408.1 integrase [Hymenobacter luteus]
MSKITFILRPENKKGEHPISIKHTHDGSPFVKATGVAVQAKYFNQITGKVSNKLPMAPEWNACIAQVYADIEASARNILGKGGEPTTQTMADEYAAIVAQRRVGEGQEPLQVKEATTLIERLYQELEALEAAVSSKKQEIQNAELKLGIYEGALFVHFIDRYTDEKKNLINTKTLKLYTNLRNLVNEFKSCLRIDDITLTVMNSFRDWLVDRGLRNLTIRSILIKFKAVINHFSEPLGLNTKELRKFVNVKKIKNKNLIYLTKEELGDLLTIKLDNPRYQRVRDIFGIMCLTGLRWSDVFFSEANVKSNVLSLTTNKTATTITLPLSSQAVEILERNNYALQRIAQSEFNTQIKVVCAMIPSLCGLEEIIHYTGTNRVRQVMPKAKLISAHAGRKTFINLCLQNGVNPAVIKGWVGHSDIKMIMEHYAHLTANQNEEIAKVFV